jgi:Iap family predicted aminopeptidase
MIPRHLPSHFRDISGKHHAVAGAYLIPFLLLVTFASPSIQQSAIVISSEEQIKAEFKSVPCKDEDRLNAVQGLFERMGATPSDMSVEKYKNVENLVLRKSGASQETIVLGAHYDKVPEGCGAIDNWTGIVTLAHLYRSLRNAQLKKTILFIAFGKEEKGLVGSRAMAAAIDKDQVTQYCEMLNVDSLGLGPPQVADNMSSRKLGSFAADVAKQMKIPFSHASIEGASADSNSFIGKKIPAVTIHGLNNNWMSVLHSRNDQPAKINAGSVYLGYRLALAMVTRLDESPCGAYR